MGMAVSLPWAPQIQEACEYKKNQPEKQGMKLMRWMMVVCLMICASALASDMPKGTVPHATNDSYDAHAEQNGTAIGATMLKPGQTKKIFKTDVGRCCLVVEVALYPQKDHVTLVSLDDFALRVTGQDIAAKPSSAKVVAWRTSRDQDRLRPALIAAMEQELSEKALPPGQTSTPVSGYLYFSMPKTKNAKYELEYMLKDKKVTLSLP
jgi:hypothetical protein